VCLFLIKKLLFHLRSDVIRGVHLLFLGEPGHEPVVDDVFGIAITALAVMAVLRSVPHLLGDGKLGLTVRANELALTGHR
jgi:hypothetical protein